MAEAALAFGVTPGQIAKSLSFKKAEETIVLVTAGDTKIDNQAFKQVFATKARMLSAQEVEDRLGYQVGGVCPFDLGPEVSVYLDDSLKRFKTVIPACGSSNSGIELNLEDLRQYANARDWVSVCKNWSNNTLN